MAFGGCFSVRSCPLPSVHPSMLAKSMRPVTTKPPVATDPRLAARWSARPGSEQVERNSDQPYLYGSSGLQAAVLLCIHDSHDLHCQPCSYQLTIHKADLASTMEADMGQCGGRR